jgi:hypothetical protein
MNLKPPQAHLALGEVIVSQVSRPIPTADTLRCPS